ncbi:MAG: hypothetical protein IKQ91_11425 [Oscillospiraceae bacterium]|nr:hypothetical protein [Oscillospiraceae bacterium]
MKKLLSCVISGALALQGLSSGAFAADSGRIRVDSASVQAGETFELPVIIEENPGVAAMSLNLTYDASKLELLGAADGKILGTSVFLSGNDLTLIPYTMNWDDLSTENNTGNGIVATLKFEVLAESGTAEISLAVNQKSTYNVDLDEVAFTTVNGAVKIGAAAEEQPDDLNGDGAVNVADAVLLARFIGEDQTLTDEQLRKLFAAKPDQNEDGLVTLMDLKALLKKIETES